MHKSVFFSKRYSSAAPKVFGLDAAILTGKEKRGFEVAQIPALCWFLGAEKQKTLADEDKGFEFGGLGQNRTADTRIFKARGAQNLNVYGCCSVKT